MNKNKVIELDVFFKRFKTRSYKKGEMLIRADDDPQGIFCLLTGYVRQYSISKTGFELTLQILKPTSFFPLLFAINNVPNIYYFEALTALEVGRAPKDEVLSFINEKPYILFGLMSQLLEDYTEALNRIEHLVFSDAYRRTISVLLYIAKYFGEDDGSGIIIRHRFTQQDIATLVGVARETANNEMMKMEKKGIIKYVDHSMLFESIKKLEQELS